MNDVYVELKDYVKFTKRKIILLEDVAKVAANEQILNKLNKIPINAGTNELIVISTLDVVKAIKAKYKKLNVNMLGNNEVVVYFINPKDNTKKSKTFKILETIVGCLLVCLGSFVAIMTFQTDVSLPNTLREIYLFFTGIDEVKPLLIQLPYSVGIFIGIITFFTKFKKAKVSPLEVTIDKYENDIKQSEVKLITKEQGKL